MVESTTLNYHWTKPEITKSASTWGKFLNDNLDAIDGLVFANQQAISPIGAITMFGGATAPANWLICDGRTLDYGTTPSYQALFNVIGRAFNTALSGTQFALPNLAQKFPLGVGPNALGTSGGTFSYTLSVANMPSHAHTASETAHTHIVWQDAHAHTVGNTQAHSHTVVTGGHVHVVTPHAHGASLMRFVGGGGQPLSITGGGNANVTYGNTDTNGSSTDTVGNLGGYTDTQALAVGNTDARTPAVYCDTKQPTITVNPNGSGSALSIVPPFTAVNFIIRYQ